MVAAPISAPIAAVASVVGALPDAAVPPLPPVSREDAPAGVTESQDGQPTPGILEKEVEHGTYHDHIASLRKDMNKRFTVNTSFNLALDVARAWWLDKLKISAAIGSDRRDRYPGLPSFGLSQNVFNYYDPNAANYALNRVIPLTPTYGDRCWRAVESSAVPSLAVRWQDWIMTAHLEGADQLRMLAPLSRMRGTLFEGQAVVRFAEAILTAEMERGYSALAPVIKCLGYLNTLTAPADSGQMQVASIPADSALAAFGDYWPWDAHHAVGPVVLNAYFVTLVELSRWLTGGIDVPNVTPSDIGIKVVLVPVPASLTPSPTVILWWMVCYMGYPFRRFRRRGVAGDGNGPLEAEDQANLGNFIPFTTRWEASTGFVEVGGVCPLDAANPVTVIFVQTEDFDVGAGRQLVFPIPGGLTIDVPLDRNLNAPVDIWGAVAFMCDAPLDRHIPDLVALQRAFGKYLGSTRIIGDAVTFWQSHIAISPLTGEWVSGGLVNAQLGPAFAGLRNWVDARIIWPWDGSNVIRVMSVPLNSSAMYPAITVGAGGVHAANPNSVHWELPRHNMTLGMAVAAGVVVYIDPAIAVDAVLPPSQLLPTFMEGGTKAAFLCDLVLLGAGVSRSVFWYGTRAAMPVQHRNNLVLLRDDVWGKRGDAATDGMCPYSYSISEVFFSGRIRAWAASNGCDFVWPQLPLGWLSPDVVAGRFDFGTLNIYGEIFPMEKEKVLDLLFIKRELTERLPDHSRDDTFRIYDPAGAKEEGMLAVQLAVRLEGLGTTVRATQIGESLRTARITALQEQHHIYWNVFSALTWGSTLAAGGPLAAFESLSFDPTLAGGGAWSVLGGRPFGSYNPLISVDMQMIVRSNLLLRVRTPEMWKARYYQDPQTDEWNRYAPVSQASHRNRTRIRI